MVQDGNRLRLGPHSTCIGTSLKNFSLHHVLPKIHFLGFGEMFAEEMARNAKHVGGSCARHCISRTVFLEESFSNTKPL